MSVLALREYERITVGDVFDAKNKVIRLDQHKALEKFGELYRKHHKVTVFAHGPRRSLIAQNFVGVIDLGVDQIEILPKIEGSVEQVRDNLAAMISMVLDLELIDQDLTFTERNEHSILEVFVALFCKKLWQCVRRGLVREYVSHSDNLSVLRGRLSVTQQVRRNSARPDRLACVFDEFTDNNPLNQVLKLSLRILSKVSKVESNRRQIAELLFCFQDVDDIAASAIQWSGIRITRLTAQFEQVLAMARLFIDGHSPDVISGGSSGFALLFDMNVLFEGYVGIMARRTFASDGISISLQGPKKYLGRAAGSGTSSFALKPDIVARQAANVEFIVDTKWKRLNESAFKEGIATSDVYQMYAYSTQYAAKNVLLLYPHHEGLGVWKPGRAQYWVNGIDGDPALGHKICIATLSLSDLKVVPQCLKEIVADMNQRQT